MIKKISRAEIREKKHRRLRHTLAGTATKPRLAVFRSDSHIYAQIIDDSKGFTLCAASSLDSDIRSAVKHTNNVEAASAVGTAIAKKALDKGINTVVFDRGGFVYQGKIQALAEAAREAGLTF